MEMIKEMRMTKQMDELNERQMEGEQMAEQMKKKMTEQMAGQSKGQMTEQMAEQTEKKVEAVEGSVLSDSKAVFVSGRREQLSDMMAELAVCMQMRGRVLFIDTLNSIDIPHPAYRNVDKEHIFRNIYCVRCQKHYDLLLRLGTAESFIEYNGIRSIMINSITNAFEDAECAEADTATLNILKIVEGLCDRYGLSAIIGQETGTSAGARQANAAIAKFQKLSAREEQRDEVIA